MADKNHDPRRNGLEPVFDQRQNYEPLPFKEPEAPKFVLVPEEPPVKLVETEESDPKLVVTQETEPNAVITEKPAAVHVSKLDQVSPEVDARVEQAFDASLGGPGTSEAYETTYRLKQGLIGERLATEALAEQGHEVLSYKPDIAGTNKPGIDIVTIKDGVVYFIDNKAYTSGRNVGSVSALDKNFEQNKQAVLAEFTEYANDLNRSQAERDLYTEAIDAIDNGDYQKAVTTAAVAQDGKHTIGITDGLSGKDFSYIDVGPSPNSGAAKPVPAFKPVPVGPPPELPFRLVPTPGTEIVPDFQPGTSLMLIHQSGTEITTTNQAGTQIVPAFQTGTQLVPPSTFSGTTAIQPNPSISGGLGPKAKG